MSKDDKKDLLLKIEQLKRKLSDEIDKSNEEQKEFLNKEVNFDQEGYDQRNFENSSWNDSFNDQYPHRSTTTMVKPKPLVSTMVPVANPNSVTKKADAILDKKFERIKEHYAKQIAKNRALAPEELDKKIRWIMIWRAFKKWIFFAVGNAAIFGAGVGSSLKRSSTKTKVFTGIAAAICSLGLLMLIIRNMKAKTQKEWVAKTFIISQSIGLIVMSIIFLVVSGTLYNTVARFAGPLSGVVGSNLKPFSKIGYYEINVLIYTFSTVCYMVFIPLVWQIPIDHKRVKVVIGCRLFVDSIVLLTAIVSILPNGVFFLFPCFVLWFSATSLMFTGMWLGQVNAYQDYLKHGEEANTTTMATRLDGIWRGIMYVAALLMIIAAIWGLQFAHITGITEGGWVQRHLSKGLRWLFANDWGPDDPKKMEIYATVYILMALLLLALASLIKNAASKKAIAYFLIPIYVIAPIVLFVLDDVPHFKFLLFDVIFSFGCGASIFGFAFWGVLDKNAKPDPIRKRIVLLANEYDEIRDDLLNGTKTLAKMKKSLTAANDVDLSKIENIETNEVTMSDYNPYR